MVHVHINVYTCTCMYRVIAFLCVVNGNSYMCIVQYLQHHNSSRRLEFSDDSFGPAYNSVLASSEEEEGEGGEVSE